MADRVYAAPEREPNRRGRDSRDSSGSAANTKLKVLNGRDYRTAERICGRAVAKPHDRRVLDFAGLVSDKLPVAIKLWPGGELNPSLPVLLVYGTVADFEVKAREKQVREAAKRVPFARVCCSNIPNSRSGSNEAGKAAHDHPP